MQQDRYNLNDLARAELAALREAGVEPTDDEIVLVNALSADVLSPPVRDALARGRPVACGGAWLWPWTIASRHWFVEAGESYADQTAALAFSMAHPTRADLHTVREADVTAWRDRLTCTPRQLNLAVSEIISQDEETDIPRRETDAGVSLGELSASMMATSGGTPEMWEHQVSIGFIRAVLGTLSAQSQAGSVSPAVTRATMALGMACETIKNRRRADG